VKKYLLQFGTVAGVATILISLIGCAQTRALNKLERLVLDDDEYHSHAKSSAISCIESIDYERHHEEVVDIIFGSGNLDLIDQLVEYFPDDFRNCIVKGDAYLKNSMMQHLIGLFMKSSADASVNKAKDSYIKALELNNKDVYALGILGFIYGDNKEYDKAEELFNKGLEIAPNNPLLYLALGQMFDRMKEYHFAINYYEIILEFTEEEVEKDFAHMNQYYHKLMEFYPDSLAKAKEEARKYLKEDYKKIGRESTL
jgi:tetratricopeptide (TPR) repeat protein|tara:strand:- start:429 stop:1196 length:768 start_codon:yes stop_codon:yes gene_type:complete